MSHQFEYDRQAKIPEQQKQKQATTPTPPTDADLGIHVPSTIHSLICLCGRELPVPDAPGTHEIRCVCNERWGISNLPKPIDLKRRAKEPPTTPTNS